MMQPSRRLASGAILALCCFFAIAARADTPASKTAPAEPLRIRWRSQFRVINTIYLANANPEFRKFQAAHPHLNVEYQESRCSRPTDELEVAKSLIQGRLDVAVLVGPIFEPRQAEDEREGRRCCLRRRTSFPPAIRSTPTW